MAKVRTAEGWLLGAHETPILGALSRLGLQRMIQEAVEHEVARFLGREYDQATQLTSLSGGTETGIG